MQWFYPLGTDVGYVVFMSKIISQVHCKDKNHVGANSLVVSASTYGAVAYMSVIAGI